MATKEQLARLLEAYDVSPWLYTTRIAIDATAIPHSHPVLTLHTQHLGDDHHLLATFLHEQLHWYLMTRPEPAVAGAFEELRGTFPEAPVGFPEGGEDEESTYLHLIVNYLELEALTAALGSALARSVIEFWTGDHYRWIYRMVLERGEEIRGILERHELLHPATAV